MKCLKISYLADLMVIDYVQHFGNLPTIYQLFANNINLPVILLACGLHSSCGVFHTI